MKSLLFGHALVSTPFCVYGGIVAADEAAQPRSEKAACDLARELGVDHLEMRNRQRSHPDWPCKDLYVTFRKAIDADSEKNMLAIPRKQRAMVRKGIKEELRAEVDSASTVSTTCTPRACATSARRCFRRRYLEILKEVFGEACDIVTILKGDRAVASVLNFYFRDEVLPYYGGGTQEARAVAGNDFMYWQVMERAREKGCRIFDYGRSKRGTGAFDFKTYWGFEPEPLYYEYFLVKRTEMPNLSPTNPRFGKAIELWRQDAAQAHAAHRAAGGEVPRMSEILFLSHRIPYPPDKGDKIRSYHLLQGARGAAHGPPRDVHRRPGGLAPRRRARAAAGRGLHPAAQAACCEVAQRHGPAVGQPLTVAYYRDARCATLGATLRRVARSPACSCSRRPWGSTRAACRCSRARRASWISATSIRTSGGSTRRRMRCR